MERKQRYINWKYKREGNPVSVVLEIYRVYKSQETPNINDILFFPIKTDTEKRRIEIGKLALFGNLNILVRKYIGYV
jgi:hypothetical protein